MSGNEAIPIRTLRNDVSQIIKRVEAGESFDVTRHGRRVARLAPAFEAPRPGTMADIDRLRADVGIDHDLLDLVMQLRSDSRDPYERFEEHHAE